MSIPAEIWVFGAIIESIILQSSPIFAPFPIIEPDTSDLLPTTTSEPITEPFLIKAVGDICAVFDINTSPLCSGVAADSIFPITKSADAFTNAAGVPISNQ